MNIKLIGILAAIVISLLGVSFWYYGRTQKDEGRREVYGKIEAGTFDRWFTRWETLPPPPPVIRHMPVVVGSVDSSALDSLTLALIDSSRVIQFLGATMNITLKDSVAYAVDDSLSFVFRAIHNLVIDPIRRTAKDIFTPLDIIIPFREHEKVVVRDPTFWQSLDIFVYGTLFGTVVMVVVWWLSHG